jgi:hypothetical protein
MQQIRNARQLLKTVSEGKHEFRLVLQGGLYSRKTIRLTADRRFRVTNHIDNSVQKLTARQLYSQSNIGKAMRMGAFAAAS